MILFACLFTLIKFITDVKINPLESWGRFQLYIKTPQLQHLCANHTWYAFYI